MKLIRASAIVLMALITTLPLRAQETDLLRLLRPDDLAKFKTEETRVFRDAATGALTLTFNYTQGEPEVRIPVRELGWPTDWSAYRAVQYTFYASSLETISIGFSDGAKTKFFITEPLPGIRVQGVIPFDSFVQTRQMNPLLPLGYKVWMQRLFTFEKVEEIVFKMRYPNQTSQFTLYNFTLTGNVPADDILDRRPLLDRFGQWIPENWPGKAHSEDELRALWKEDQLEPAEYPFCPLGGDRSRTLRATGFFRTENIDGRWVFVDPHGHPFYSAGMDLVGYKQGSFATDVTRREFLFEELPPAGPAWLEPGKEVSFYIANIMKRFGDGWENKWTEHILARLKNWGFNTVANWSDRELAVHSGMPYVLPLSGWTTKKMFPFPYDFPDVFSKGFEENVDGAAKRQCELLKDDANLIGWFIGNEPRWARDFGSLTPWAEMVLQDPEPSATQDKLKQMLAASPNDAAKIKEEFLYTCGRKYFETINAAIRKYDPNHLNLGIRFAGRPDERWVRMSSMFDTFSLNIYSATVRPDPEMVRHFAELSGKPVVIGEFTAAAPGRGMQGLFYYVHKVRDQAERGKAYSYYVENSAADPYIIGSHWFQMVDDLPTGRPSDEERLNYGFINVIDLPYQDLVRAARQTHRKLYDLKFGKTPPTQEKPRYN
jgi:hypothetical protein